MRSRGQFSWIRDSYGRMYEISKYDFNRCGCGRNRVHKNCLPGLTIGVLAIIIYHVTILGMEFATGISLLQSYQLIMFFYFFVCLISIRFKATVYHVIFLLIFINYELCKSIQYVRKNLSYQTIDSSPWKLSYRYYRWAGYA